MGQARTHASTQLCDTKDLSTDQSGLFSCHEPQSVIAHTVKLTCPCCLHHLSGWLKFGLLCPLFCQVLRIYLCFFSSENRLVVFLFSYHLISCTRPTKFEPDAPEHTHAATQLAISNVISLSLAHKLLFPCQCVV